MPFDRKDVRTDGYRDGSVYWNGKGKHVHIPTGLAVEYEEAWNDQSGKRRALEELERLVEETTKRNA